MSYRGSFSALHASFLSVFFFFAFFGFLLFKASMSCVKAYCVFGCFTLLPPSNFSHQPSCGLRLTGFNHAWLSHTLNHAVASLIVCYYPSCISIRDALPPSPPPLFTGEASRHESDAVLPLCGATQWGKRGGTLSSVFVVTAVQINSEEDALRVCRLPSWLPFRPHAPSLFRAVTRGI